MDRDDVTAWWDGLTREEQERARAAFLEADERADAELRAASGMAPVSAEGVRRHAAAALSTYGEALGRGRGQARFTVERCACRHKSGWDGCGKHWRCMECGGIGEPDWPASFREEN